MKTNHKGRDTQGNKSLRHVAGTGRRNNSPRVARLMLWKEVSLRQNFVATKGVARGGGVGVPVTPFVNLFF